MRKTFYTFMILCFGACVWGQVTFAKKLNVGLGDVGCSVRQLEDGYLLMGSHLCNGIQSQCLSILRTDANGDLLTLVEYQNYPWWFCSSNFGGNACVYVAPDSTFYFTGVIENQGQPADVFLMKTDYNGDSLWMKSYGENNPLLCVSRDLIPTADSTLLLFNEKVTQGDDSNPWIVEVDMEGNVLRELNVGEQYASSDPQSILLLSNGDMVVSDVNYASIPGHTSMTVTRINHEGEVLWENRFGEFEGLYMIVHTGLVPLDDGGFLVSWQRFNMSQYSHTQLMLTWLDSMGNITQQKYLPDFTRFHLEDLIKTEKGTIIGVGDIYLHTVVPELGSIGGWVFEMTQNGEMLWERYIQDISLPDKIAWFSNVIENNVGGITISGSILTPTGYDIWLVQLDSVGCFEPGCIGEVQVVGGIYSDVEETTNHELRLYPNPVTGDQLYLDVPDDFPSNETVEVLLFDMLGRVVRKQPFTRAIDISDLESGIYLLKLSKEGEVVNWVGKFIRE